MEFPSSTKSTKDAIRVVIGHDVDFTIQGEASPCVVCSGLNDYDPVNEISLNPFCDTCSGAYWITADTVERITGHVRWRTGDESDYGIAGEVLEGDCIITISSDDLTSSQIVNIKKIVVDSKMLEHYRIIERGVPTRDRVRFICREYGKQ